MRKAVVPMRKYLGYAATEGLSQLVQSEWEDGEYSSQGETDPDERARLRAAANIPAGNLEQRPVAWKSNRVRYHLCENSIINPNFMAPLFMVAAPTHLRRPERVKWGSSSEEG